MIEQNYVQIPERIILDDLVQDGHKVQNGDRGWLVCPDGYKPKTSFKLPMKAGNGRISDGKVRKFSGPNSQKRQCEIAEDFKLRDLGGFVVPYLKIAQKGGGPSGDLAYSTSFVSFSHSQDPVGYFGCVDADKELAISSLLLKAGFPSCEVLRIIKLDPQRLIDFMSEIWSSDIVLRNLHIDQINKIIRNGDKPALIYRHMGMNFRMMMDVFNKSGSWEDAKEIVDRLRLVFSNWEEVDKASFQAQIQGSHQSKESSNESILEMYIAYCNWFDAYFSSRIGGHKFFPAHPVDTDMLGMVCDFEYEKRDKLTSLSPVASKIKKAVLASI